MTDKAAPGSRPTSRTKDRTLKATTIGVAVVSLGLSGLFTYQAASASAVNPVPTPPTVAPTSPPASKEKDDDDYVPSGAGAPRSAPAGKPVAVSGGS
jgi:hypothetical protein